MNRPRLNRRRFLAVSALAALRASGVAAPAPPPRHKYIDLHTHLGAFRYGQQVRVKVLEADEKGRLRLSMKALLTDNPEASVEQQQQQQQQ